MILFAVFAIKTVYRSNVYKDELSFAATGAEESPEIIILHSLEGDEYINCKNFAKASECYTTAIKIKPLPRFYFRRAQCYYAIKQYDNALDDFNTALAAFKNDKRYQNELIGNYGEACLGRSKTHFFLGHYDSAMVDLQQAIKLHSVEIPPTYFSQLNDKLQKEKVALYTNKINNEPPQAFNYYQRGMAIFNLGDVRNALPDFDRAIELEPNSVEFIYGRFQIYSAMGDKQNAEGDKHTLLGLGYKIAP